MRDQKYWNEIALKEAARLEAEWANTTAACNRAAEEQAKDFHDQFAPKLVACGVRPIAIDHLIERAATLFELKDGQVVAKPGVHHPRDPVADLDPITWLADLRNGTDGDLLFGK